MAMFRITNNSTNGTWHGWMNTGSTAQARVWAATKIGIAGGYLTVVHTGDKNNGHAFPQGIESLHGGGATKPPPPPKDPPTVYQPPVIPPPVVPITPSSGSDLNFAKWAEGFTASFNSYQKADNARYEAEKVYVSSLYSRIHDNEYKISQLAGTDSSSPQQKSGNSGNSGGFNIGPLSYKWSDKSSFSNLFFPSASNPAEGALGWSALLALGFLFIQAAPLLGSAAIKGLTK